MPNHPIQADFFGRVKFFGRVALVLVLLLVCLGGLVACGKRPGEVDPAAGVSKDVYYRVYPNPQTDPKP